MSYESEERYWTDYLRVALPVIGLLPMLALFWWWAQQFIGDDKDGNQATVTDPTEEVTLSVSHAWDATFMERQNQFDELFTERHPTIKIAAENTAWADLLAKYATLAAGDELPDITYVHFSWAQQMIKADLLLGLDDYIAGEPDFNLADFTPPSLVSYKRDEKLYRVVGPTPFY